MLVGKQALDTALTLAGLLADKPDEQVRVLEAAIAHSPYAGPLYQAAMRAHAALDSKVISRVANA